ncbi:MAG: YoaK family protein [Ignavibacteriales bacterium]
MQRYSKSSLTLAALLAALAGYVDALGFLQLGGFFVSFMSGNSTRLGVGAAAGNFEAVGIAGGLVAVFVAGVVVGVLVGREDWRWRRPAILSLVCFALLVSAVAHGGEPRWAMTASAFAMGALNALFQREGDVAIGVTYMTGALVRMGHRIAMALRGGPKWDFLPFLMLWVSLTTGATLGALTFRQIGVGGLWVAAAVALALTAIVGVRDRES